MHKTIVLLFFTMLIPSFLFAEVGKTTETIEDKTGTIEIPTQNTSKSLTSSLHALQEKQFYLAKPSILYTKKHDINLKVPLYKQKSALSCECAATHAAATYLGYTLSEQACQEQLPVYEGPKVGGVWGDPNEKFIGNVHARQRDFSGYGVYPLPLQTLLHKEYIASKASYNTPMHDLLLQLIKEKPVVVWTPYAVGTCWEKSWQIPSGKKLITCLNEHASVVQGFKGTIAEPESIRIMDVYPGVYREISIEKFESGWESMDRMALFID
jgi:uncharacterized protein YvpB